MSRVKSDFFITKDLEIKVPTLFRSKDLSLCSKSGKASGGQKGHKGTTLEFSTVPTEVQQHFPQGVCTNCDLEIKNEGSDQIIKERRQVVDIPLITPVITEHQLSQITH